MPDFCDELQYKSLLAWQRELTLIVVYNISQVVLSSIVSLSYTHGVVCEVDIAVVA